MSGDKAPDAGAPPGRARPTPVVLVVDDDANNRDLLARHLSKEEIRIVTAANGGDAIAAYCRNDPAIVLLDIRMPGVDGLEFLKWLSREPAEQRAPTIVLTGNSDRGTVEAAAGLGAVGYIIKPIDGEDVRQRVRSLLANRREVHLG